MNKYISSLLFYPFEKEQLPYPRLNSEILFWNAEYVSDVQCFKNVDVLQSFKPYAAVWETHGIKVHKQLFQDKKYENIFCTLPKQKEAALYMLASSLERLSEDGLLIAVAANDAGGKKIEKWLRGVGIVPTSLSKSKCRIVWASKAGLDQEKINFYIQKGQQKKIDIQNQSFVTQPGIFGWNKIDKGSRFLIENLPNGFSGKGADFGAGYGYLSSEILQKNSDIQKLYVLEADSNALSCAQKNLKLYEDRVDIEYGWTDLTQRQEIENLDWVVMNPPFHKEKETQSDIGKNFIIQAAASLKKGGALYMVANTHLPYEKILDKNFSNVNKIYEDQGYKVFIAQK